MSDMVWDDAKECYVGTCQSRTHRKNTDEPRTGRDLCQDGYCRACHVTIGFEECCDGSWVAAQRQAAGIPTHNADGSLR